MLSLRSHWGGIRGAIAIFLAFDELLLVPDQVVNSVALATLTTSVCLLYSIIGSL